MENTEDDYEEIKIEPIPYENNYMVQVGSCSVSHSNIKLACKLARALFDIDDLEECYRVIDRIVDQEC